MTDQVHLTPGAVLGGDFRLLEPLGRGGMGVVYRAEQRSTGKQRAVKVMHTLPVEGDKQRQRFEQEARVGARIRSDHVVEVIGAGVDEDAGVPWLAMELLEGEDLGELVDRRGAIGGKQVAEIFQQLCHALGAAHEAGIVHRDVKPQNVFLAQAHSPQAPTSVKVLDFGIAKVAATGKTTSTALVGSPAWMAPEQTDPRARVTAAADVWALGLLAFWLLTGRAYWLCAEDEAASMHALMREVLFEPIVPASQRAAELGCAEALPGGFDEWFARCMAREPADRFPDARRAGTALEQVLTGSTPPAHTAGTGATDLALMSTRELTSAVLLGAATEAEEDGESAAVAASPDRADDEASRPRGGDRGSDEQPAPAT
ncbi:MAG: serine/threonine protein kinase, partial [Deltaproteobacteria bacterium]|nr:serine/threonine protein kinase [Deltaproteobacteria bacterium]MBW2536726.1 serine/threonine protein kinase [Deltaproteobacteria bacterium]